MPLGGKSLKNSLGQHLPDESVKKSFLKQNKIPFILFVSTEPVGKKGYMTWEQIKEVEAEEFALIGHHSHSHGYLIDKDYDFFISDIEKANQIFLNNY